MNKGFFLDRDGIINEVKVVDGITRGPDTLSEFRFKEGVLAFCEFLRNLDFKLIIVTNQPDVARGLQTRERVEEINRYILDTIQVEDLYVCYHDNADLCDCRKPKPGMLIRGAQAHHLSLTDSYMLGDRWSDVEAGKKAGCRTILYDNPYSSRNKCSPDYVVDSFEEIKLIIGTDHKKDETT